jgi:dephospho-CoA kinase
MNPPTGTPRPETTRFQPSPWYALLRYLPWILALAVLGVGASILADRLGFSRGSLAAWAGAAASLLLVLIAAFERTCAECSLDPARVAVRWGVLRRTTVELPLAKVRETIVGQSLLQRFLGVGNVLIGSGGTSGAQVLWPCVDDPHAKLELVRRALDHHAAHLAHHHADHPTQNPARRPLVIGITGGIGAGKSFIARAFERLGCLVVDSDHESRLVLNKPETLRTLQEWWGPGVVNNAQADRAQIAKIVFSDPAQRRRLEALIHPQVHAARAAAVAQATREERPAVIVDAPLLHEAGVDKECDAVVFVDAPPELREQRVRTRGWDKEELSRRESTQLSLEEKRRRADAVIHNDAPPEVIQGRVRTVLNELLARPPRPGGGGNLA